MPNSGSHLPPRLTLKDCWAKTDEQGKPALNTHDHSLHVGAVAEVIYHLFALARKLAPMGAILLIACHDIGKISPGFLLKSAFWQALWKDILGFKAPGDYEPNHAKSSQHFFLDWAETSWIIAVGGHHGKYPMGKETWVNLEGIKTQPPDLKELQDELFAELQGYWGAPPTEEIIPVSDARLHWFTGFMTICDWIGSSTAWFPLSCDAETLGSARAKATQAVHALGWIRREVKTEATFSEMFGFAPHPLQTTLINAMDAPGLYIVEAAMGEGKTEAALAAAYTRWTQGEEQGLYFALPTQLTSNRIHERIEHFLVNIVADTSTLGLVHGNAWLTDHHITPLVPPSQDVEGKKNAQEANRWFSDSRKALLLPFGVGTIDQALMATMPVKFSAPRLFALSGKIIVFDEVHSYDPYTSALLDRTIKWLREVGCTIIILSATLTQARRVALIQAARGSGEEVSSTAYPLITKVTDAGTESLQIAGYQSPNKTVQIKSLPVEGQDWKKLAVAAALAGACVLVVRNTVASAQETFRELKGFCPDSDVAFGLLHSRFPQFQRENQETHWMECLGRNGANRPPRGCLLVGTQVVEQSVDIDADILITDLAPTELILQRLGRLHRHARPRPLGFHEPCGVILQPTLDLAADEKTLTNALGLSGKIYPPYVLCRSYQIWREKTSVLLPGEIRSLLEASSAVPAPLPAGLHHLREDYDLKREKMIKATQNTGAVFGTPHSEDEEGKNMRWQIPPSGFVVLLREPIKESRTHREFHFLNGSQHTQDLAQPFDFELARQLQLNAVRVPLYVIQDQLKTAPDWLGHYLEHALIAFVQPDTHELDTRQKGTYRLCYSPELGLWHESMASKASPQENDDDHWF